MPSFYSLGLALSSTLFDNLIINIVFLQEAGPLGAKNVHCFSRRGGPIDRRTANKLQVQADNKFRPFKTGPRINR